MADHCEAVILNQIIDGDAALVIGIGAEARADAFVEFDGGEAVAAGIIGCGHDAVKLGEIVRQRQGPSDHAREGWAFPRPLPDL